MRKINKKSLLFDLQLINNKIGSQKIQNSDLTINKKYVPNQVNKRNRDRLAAKRLSTQMAIGTFQQQSEWHTYFYLSSLLQKNALPLFDKDLKHAIKENSKKENTHHLILLKELELERLIIQASLNQNEAKRLLDLLNETDSLLKTLQRNNTFRKRSYEAFLSSVGLIAHKRNEEELAQNIWQEIYLLRKKTYQSKSLDEKIKFLKQIFELTQKINSNASKRDQAAASANLSTYYMLKGEFDASHHYYTIAISLRKYLRPSNLQSLQYNYIGANLRNNQFQRAYDAILQVEDTILSNPSLHFKFILLKCMCYLFADKHKEIKKIMPEKPIKKDKLDLSYYYVIWSIYFLSQHKPDTCDQMLDTAKRFLKKKPSEKALPTFIKLVKQYNELSLTYSPKKVQILVLQQLNIIDLNELSSGNILPLLWLKQFVSK